MVKALADLVVVVDRRQETNKPPSVPVLLEELMVRPLCVRDHLRVGDYTDVLGTEHLG